MRNRRRINNDDMRSYYAIKDDAPTMEAYRVLRTNIEFSNSMHKLQTVMITSSVMQEGKSTTASNLAKVFAYAGVKTLLLDLDLRRPVQHHLIGVDNTVGIMEMVLGKATAAEAVKPTELENLYVLNAGTRPPNPTEILASKAVEKIVEDLRESFEMIIIDTPPVAVLADAAITSRFADAVLVVVAVQKADTDDLDSAIKNLRTANANILGVVMNNVSRTTRGYKHYGYYYHYY